MITALLRRLRAGERGYALVAVMGIGIMMLALVATALTVTSSGQTKANTDQDFSAALAAAYAGLDDYKARVANDKRYVRYGNEDAPFSRNAILAPPPTPNPAFNSGIGQDWAMVPESDPDNPSFFRYEVDNSEFYQRGVLTVRATGKVGTTTRSVVANLRQSGFFDYVYFTHFETQDPAISGTRASCGNFVWLRTPGTGPACVNIQFGPNDALYGDVHSNDRLLVCGAQFYGEVTSAAPDRFSGTTIGQWTTSSCAAGHQNTRIFQKGEPKAVTAVRIPPTNDEMALETRADQPDIVADPGCMYTGPTEVTFLDDGTMRVVSPWTKVTQESFTAGIASRNPESCGVVGTAPGQLGHSAGAIVPVPDGNLFYVQRADDRVGYPNYWAPNAYPAHLTCTGAGKDQHWSLQTPVASGAPNPIVRYRHADEVIPATSTDLNPAYACREGDLFIKGDLEGRVTAAAGRYVYITGDIKYTPGTIDVMGLVAQKAVWVWNPMNSSSAPILGDSAAGRTINGALLSVDGTFQVQNWNKGGHRGTLRVTGSIAQNFRGTVAQPPNGYDKDYRYDPNLEDVAPPKFLAPSTTTFEMSQSAVVPRAYDADGGQQVRP